MSVTETFAQAPVQHAEPTTSSSAARLSAGAGAAALLGGSAFVAYFDPTQVHFFPVCLLYSVTGFACPGCGLTRGFHSLFHGDLVGALGFNAFVPVWAVIIAWTFISLSLLAIRGRGLKMWPTNPRFLYGFMCLLVVFGVVRNIPAWPFTFLFP
ncbi:MAG: DUF2752 domain-containing protein [Chloracidobacterium sp.]|nr:DUF2752 domain-containing protein [Chloracidobacterium sp.]